MTELRARMELDGSPTMGREAQAAGRDDVIASTDNGRRWMQSSRT